MMFWGPNIDVHSNVPPAPGDLMKDGAAMTLFEDSGLEYFIAQSFAKNFGLYGERIGYIHVKCKTKETQAAVPRCSSALFGFQYDREG